MLDKLEELVKKAEGIASKSEQLRKQIDEVFETYGQPGTPDSPFAKVPLIAADWGRALLEKECRRWKVIAILGWGLLIVAVAVFAALSLLVN